MLNSPFMIDRARALVTCLEHEASYGEASDAGSADDEQRIQRAYRLLYGRPPAAQELRIGREFVNLPNNGENAGMTPGNNTRKHS